MPYLSYSDFDDGENSEVHHTSSVGIRWDSPPSAALKIQYDDVKDDGGLGLKVAGDANAISLSVDLVIEST